MTQRLFRYRPRGARVEEDRERMEWFPIEGAPAAIQGDDGTWWDLVPSRLRDTTQAFKCMREGFRSVQLPKWWPFAKRHDKNGACVFANEEEAKEAVKRAVDAGEKIAWDR